MALSILILSHLSFQKTSQVCTPFVSITMGVTKTVHVKGTGPQPLRGQKVTVAFTGWLKDTSKPDNKGRLLVKTYNTQDTRPTS